MQFETEHSNFEKNFVVVRISDLLDRKLRFLRLNGQETLNAQKAGWKPALRNQINLQV